MIRKRSAGEAPDPNYTFINIRSSPKDKMNNLLVAFIIVEALQALAFIVFVLVEIFTRPNV